MRTLSIFPPDGNESHAAGDFFVWKKIAGKATIQLRNPAHKENPMKHLFTLVLITLGCSIAQAADPVRTPQQTRMATCQKEATASGKKGPDRSQILRTCLSAGKKEGKEAKPA